MNVCIYVSVFMLDPKPSSPFSETDRFMPTIVAYNRIRPEPSAPGVVFLWPRRMSQSIYYRSIKWHD